MDNNNNNAFVLGTERVFERTESDIVGLGFMPMPHQIPSLSSSSSSSCCCYDEGFDHGGCCGAAAAGGPVVCNTSNQEPCSRGDIYDVVGVLKSLQQQQQHQHHNHPFSSDPGEMAAAAAAAMPVNNARVPFTAAQWQELERQTMIYKYMMASVPVPAELLIPIARNSSNVMKGSLELGFSSTNSSDPEPWRCRRTDGKKWRCSRDVAPDQKYCERHSHKSRPRSRKHVELQNHSSNLFNTDNKPQSLNNSNNNMALAASDCSNKQPHQNPHFMNHNDAHFFTFDQSRCLEWFVKGETTAVPFASNSNTDWHQFKAQGSTNYGLNEQFSNPSLGPLGGTLNLNQQTHSQETRAFIDAWSTEERDVVGIGNKGGHVSSNEKLLTLSMSGGNENNREEDDDNGHELSGFGIMGGLATDNVRGLRPPTPHMGDGPISWMGSSPGGPLAEALCLGISSTRTTSTSSCSKST